MLDIDSMLSPKVYLFAGESKDVHCLRPIISALEERYGSVAVITYNVMCDNLAKFSTEDCPVAVFSTFNIYEYAQFIRGGRPFVAIGIEHGVAPYKRYTYNERFLEYDLYISPTQLWADRLARLHGRYRDMFVGYAYPRLDDLAERVAIASNDPHPAWGGAPKNERDLVILSWGVKPQALMNLPDRPGVVYLVHPAMQSLVNNYAFKQAKILLSTPDDAAHLIAGAQRIFGDFSSMTLEAAVFHDETYMVIDSGLYVGNCDLALEFFDRTNPAFGAVPHTDLRLSKAYVLDLEQLSACLQGERLEPEFTLKAWAAPELLPELGGQAEKTVALIGEAINRLWSQKLEQGRMSPELRAMAVVQRAYFEVLGRAPDFQASIVHAQKLLANPAAWPAKTLALFAQFADSPEGKKRWAANTFKMPEIKLEPLGKS